MADIQKNVIVNVDVQNKKDIVDLEATLRMLKTDLSSAQKELDSLNKIQQQNGKLTAQQQQQFTNLSDKIITTKQGINDTNVALSSHNKTVQDSGTKLTALNTFIGNISQSFPTLGKAMTLASVGVQGLGTAFKALIANPVGAAIMAIVAVVLKIKDAFNSSEEASDSLNKALAPLKSLGDLISQAFEKIAIAIASVIGVFSNFVAKIMTNLAPVGDLFNTVGKAISNLLPDGFVDKLGAIISKITEMVNPLNLMTKAVGSAAAALNDLIGGSDEVSKKTTKQIELEKNVAAEEDELEKTRRTLTKSIAKDEADAAEAYEKASDSESYSLKERIKMAESAVKSEKRASDQRIALAAKELKMLKDKAALAPNDKKVNDDLAAAEAKLDEVRRQSERTMKRYIATQNNLTKQTKEEAEAAAETRRQNSIDYYNKLLEIRQQEFNWKKEKIQLQTQINNIGKSELEQLKNNHQLTLANLNTDWAENEAIKKSLINKGEFNKKTKEAYDIKKAEIELETKLTNKTYYQKQADALLNLNENLKTFTGTLEDSKSKHGNSLIESLTGLDDEQKKKFLEKTGKTIDEYIALIKDKMDDVDPSTITDKLTKEYAIQLAEAKDNAEQTANIQLEIKQKEIEQLKELESKETNPETLKTYQLAEINAEKEKIAILSNMKLNALNDNLRAVSGNILAEWKLKKDYYDKEIQAIQDNAKAEKKARQDALNANIRALKTQGLTDAQQISAAAKLRIDAHNADVEGERDAADKIKKINSDKAQNNKETTDKIIDKVNEYSNDVVTLASDFAAIQNNKDQAELEAFEKKQEVQTKSLDKRLKTGKISEAKYNQEVEKMNAEKEKKEKEIAIKKAERDKQLSIATTIINTSTAVVKTLADLGATPAGIIAAAFASAMGLAQIAVIESQNVSKFAHGGLVGNGMYLNGPSHSQGGIKLEAEGGEAIINKRSTAMFRPLLSKINSFNGYGTKFAEGGMVSEISATNLGLDNEGFVNQIADAVSKRPSYVAVEDIERASKQYTIVNNITKY